MKFTEREQYIMQEAFMTGRIYNSMGEKESPTEIQKILEENCIRAVKQNIKPKRKYKRRIKWNDKDCY